MELFLRGEFEAKGQEFESQSGYDFTNTKPGQAETPARRD
jgi:hypothetical protein